MAGPYSSNPSLSPFSSPSSVPLQSAVAAYTGSAGISFASSSAMSMSPINNSVQSQPAPGSMLLCRRGQETVQEIIVRTTEIFQYLRTMQLPNGLSEPVQKFQERKAKLDEPIKQLELLFRKLRAIYDRVNDATASLDAQPVEDLLPYEEENVVDEKPIEPKFASDEERELIEQIQLKNRQLKDVIDLLRTVIWEINTMMAIRRTGSQ